MLENVARPREFDSVEVEQELLAVFWSRGYACTSIENLIEATGLLRGSLYAAYGDKDNMFRTAASLYIAELAAQNVSHEFLDRNLTAEYPYSSVHYLLTEGRDAVRHTLGLIDGEGQRAAG